MNNFTEFCLLSLSSQSFFVTLSYIQNYQVMEKKLLRSRNQMIAGVCAGLANYFNFDPTLVRVGYVLLSVLSVGFPGILVYIILWLVMPMEE
jgi:phage shock protein C